MSGAELYVCSFRSFTRKRVVELHCCRMIPLWGAASGLQLFIVWYWWVSFGLGMEMNHFHDKLYISCYAADCRVRFNSRVGNCFLTVFLDLFSWLFRCTFYRLQLGLLKSVCRCSINNRSWEIDHWVHFNLFMKETGTHRYSTWQKVQLETKKLIIVRQFNA